MILLLLFFEGMNMLDRKAFGGNVGIKLDINKVFDTFHWDFLFAMLYKLGFHSQLINSLF